MYWWHGSAWGWLGMTLGMLAFWALVAWVVVALVRSSATSAGFRPAARSAADILAERFARGEIEADEYHRRLDALRPTSRQ